MTQPPTERGPGPPGGATQTDGGSIGLLECLLIGIGGMIGGGIFAVLGLAVRVGEGGTFVAFFMAGIVALLTAYSYDHQPGCDPPR
ncbi:MAG: hypothetical protein KDA94_08410 [Acidimicrobiales bacterium]|nr:hypothetical protein [Acidimicrobiales bacterium]